jgi:uncharacterized membrane protein (UPF0136 family)
MHNRRTGKTAASPCLEPRDLTRSKYGLGGLRIRNRQPYGLELALVASIILAGSSIPRAIKSQKPLPAALSALAIYGLWTFGSAYRAST